MNAEHKRFKVAEISASGEVRAVFSTFNVVDLGGDCVEPGAISNGASVALSQWNHGSWNPGMPPIGVGKISTTSTEAIFEGRFLLDTAAGRDTFLIVRAMAEMGLGEWSYSLHNIESRKRRVGNREVRSISSVLVREVSPVMAAESLGTRTLTAKEHAELEAIRQSLDDAHEGALLIELTKYARHLMQATR